MRLNTWKTSSFWNVILHYDDDSALKNVRKTKTNNKKHKQYKTADTDHDKMALSRKPRVILIKEKLSILTNLLKLIVENNDKFDAFDNNVNEEFQTMTSRNQDSNADKDSLSLLAEQESPSRSQDDGNPQLSTTRGEKDKGNWKCPRCPNSYKYEKSLRAHMEKKHGRDRSGRDDKRKRDDSDEEEGRPRSRTETIGEGGEVDEALLGDTI